MSKKGAATYNKIRSGGYGYQLTYGYGNRGATQQYCGTGSYTARISSGQYHVDYSLSDTSKTPKPKATKSKPTKVKVKKTARIKPKNSNPWQERCAHLLNPKRKREIREQVMLLQTIEKAWVTTCNYSPQFHRESPRKFETLIWLLEDLAVTPRSDLDLPYTPVVNVVNLGIYPIRVTKVAFDHSKENGDFLPRIDFSIEPNKSEILDLTIDTMLEIGTKNKTYFTLRFY
ncbi:MAG: hypothetical protein K2H85_08675 [Allobaculum sp.]|nr:hypothetical protein [Allobaculum sp.]